MSFFFKSSPQDPLQIIFSNLDKASQSHCARGKIYEDIYVKIVDLIQSEASVYTQQIKESLSYMNDIANTEKKFSQMEARVKDDFQDIYERNRVIKQFEESQIQAIKDYENIKIQVSNAKYQSQFGSNNSNSQNESSYKQLLDEKRKALEKAKYETRHLIEAKKKYLSFVHNRIQHALQTYGEALIYAGKTESEFYEKIASQMSEIRSHIEETSHSPDAKIDNLPNPFESL